MIAMVWQPQEVGLVMSAISHGHDGSMLVRSGSLLDTERAQQEVEAIGITSPMTSCEQTEEVNGR